MRLTDFQEELLSAGASYLESGYNAIADERGSPKAEPAARLWLVRYLSEGTPSLGDVGELPRASRSSSGEDDRRIR
jgi:hypothetical protein